MRNLITAVLLAVAAQLAVAAPINLVQNGDFEIPVAGPGSVPGWSYTGGDSYFGVDADYIGSPLARPGLVFYDGAAVNTGFLSQSIATTAGATYRLEFDLQRFNTSGMADDNLASFDFGAAPVFSQLDTGGDWTHYIINGLVAGPGASTLLTFSSVNAFDFTQLDNVSVVLVDGDTPISIPEPRTPAVLAAGLAAYMLARRRRPR